MRKVQRHRSGMALVYTLIIMTGLMAFISLAVDYGRVQVVKTQLRRTADAAARYGAYGLSDGTAVLKAQDAADDQKVNGLAYSILSSDVSTGNWTTATGFVAGGLPTNAVQVSAVCTSARGTAVPLLFGQFIGRSSCDVHASATATYTANPDGEFVGYTSVSVKNNTTFDSYNSSVSTDPTTQNTGKGMVGSNGLITGGNNSSVNGDVLGPTGLNLGITYTGKKIVTTVSAPTMPTYTSASNPGRISASYTAGNGTVLAGGTYHFTSLTISGSLTFSGAAVLYVNGPIDIQGDLKAYGNIPSNLVIYGYGGNTIGDSKANGVTIIADIWAPTCDFVLKNNCTICGRGFFNTVTTQNGCDFYYDTAFGAGYDGKTVTLVK